MTTPSEIPPIYILPSALEGLGTIATCVPPILAGNIETLCAQKEVPEEEWKEIRERMTIQITVDNEIIRLRELIGKTVGTVVAVALLAGLYFAVPAIAGSPVLLFLTAFVIALMSVAIFFVTMSTINRLELKRMHVLNEFLEAMPSGSLKVRE